MLTFDTTKEVVALLERAEAAGKSLAQVLAEFRQMRDSAAYSHAQMQIAAARPNLPTGYLEVSTSRLAPVDAPPIPVRSPF